MFLSEELITRFKTAIIAASVALLLVIWSSASFTFLVLIGAAILAMEWQRISDLYDPVKPYYGLLYIALPCLCLILLRNDSVFATMHLLFIVWATDIVAYFTGKTLGGPKLLPSISPNKTWAGLLGGIGAAALVAAVFSSTTLSTIGMAGWLLCGAFLAIISQAGDFFASWLKRKADIKDTGTLLPGHGGLMDRVDGLLFAAPAYAIIYGLSHA